MRFVDARLRPSIQVEPDEIAAYYRSHLSSSAGGQPISLQEATPKIRELLTQEKMNQELNSWLESLRSQAEIRTFPFGFFRLTRPGPMSKLTGAVAQIRTLLLLGRSRVLAGLLRAALVRDHGFVSADGSPAVSRRGRTRHRWARRDGKLSRDPVPVPSGGSRPHHSWT